MRTSLTAFDLFRHPESLVNVIPHGPSDSSLLDPLVTNYLDHYQLNLYQESLVSKHEVWQSDINGCRIVEQRWLSMRSRHKTLFIVHGYFDHSALYGKLIRWGLHAGFDVHCFDLPGHGLSGGQPAAIDSFDRYSEVLSTILEREAGAYYHLIGQSTGAAVIMNTLLNVNLSPRLSKEPEQVILLAPLVRSLHWQRMRWLYFILRNILASIKRNFVKSSHDESFNTFLKNQDPLQAERIPLVWLGAMEAWVNALRHLPSRRDISPLIIQGTHDTTVDWRYNLAEMKRCLPAVEIQFIEGAMHHLVNESDPFWKKVVDCLDKRLSVVKTE